MARTGGRSWLRRSHVVARPAVRLVCFPHAGGSAASYAGFAGELPARAELAVAQYPGRGDRFVEPAVEDVRRMAAQVSAELLTLEPTATVLFGHSLGALVAYETALVLQRSGVRPERLVVSASPPPRLAGGGDTHLRDDDELWSIVCGFGGVEPEIAADADLRSILLPTLRSDVRANELYEPPAQPIALDCPVVCYHGIGDPLVDEAQLAEWGEVSTGSFSVRRRAGGHFHVFHEVGELIEDIFADVPIDALRRRAVS
ncbi:thioesterase II family protein [Kribbella sp. CA-293567]|uniref:thioesterase II family protein n=1 Tax=Kribbella sp. CA-293567 TaxID=3002436 RepID=UPI0022DDAF64|nr:alpha/beta fold hydrolase [Kribbella sp. CA-293567]WBQ07893.1 alpha/beta fold hydrolase [Kribbella sp. CA-293567]